MAVRELSSPPSMRTLYPRAIAGSTLTPVLRKLPVIGGGKADLPDLELALGDVEIEREHLNDYSRVCGFRLRDEAPATYPHLIAFPLSMKIMTDGDFPFPVIGLVHVANRIEQRQPARAGEEISVRVGTEDLRPHNRGTQFDVVAELEGSQGASWSSRSTYLHREGGGDGGPKKSSSGGEPHEASAVWEVPGDIGRRYAAVSGDRNPIHMNGLAAKLFGMPRAIAHGMWLKARCLAALESSLPAAYAVEVSFKLPVAIPTKVGFSSWAQDGGRAFALHDRKGEKPHLSGSVRPA